MIAEPRIKDSSAWLWAGVGFLAFAVLLGVFAAADAPGAAALASAFALFAGGCLFVAFWRGLFRKIELRLIDIQSAVTGERVPSEPDETLKRNATVGRLGDH